MYYNYILYNILYIYKNDILELSLSKQESKRLNIKLSPYLFTIVSI